MARRKQDEETIEIQTAPFEDAPATDQAPAEPTEDAPQNLQSEPGELAPPIRAFNLLHEKHPDTYPEWEGLTDDERVAFINLYNRANDDDVQGNPYVECAKEVLNV
jgi:hypothetical protein